MKTTELIFNGLLVGATGYTMYRINGPSERPYAFVASSFGLCHGLLGMIRAYKDGDDHEDDAVVKEISRAIMEIVPLSLVNIELYNMSDSSNLALGHGLFIIPLSFDIISKLFCDDPEDDVGNTTATLKHLTILGNIASLLYLTVQEKSPWYGAMAVSAFVSRYGALALGKYCEDEGELLTIFCDTLFFGLAAKTMGGSQKK